MTGGPVREVTERVVAYDEAGRTLVYEAMDQPRLLSLARNRWQVTALEDGRSRVGLEATVELRGALGPVLGLLLRQYFVRLGRQVLADLAYVVEHGEP